MRRCIWIPEGTDQGAGGAGGGGGGHLQDSASGKHAVGVDDDVHGEHGTPFPGWEPGAGLMKEMEWRVEALASTFNEQDVANTLVRGGQTSPHKPRLAVSRSTCPPLSSSSHTKLYSLLIVYF